jgi:hypothetical protein
MVFGIFKTRALIQPKNAAISYQNTNQNEHSLL